MTRRPHGPICNPASDLLPFVVPEPAVLMTIQDVVGPVFQRMKVIGKQAKTLATLRDTLLPRLICGQLRLPQAEALVA